MPKLIWILTIHQLQSASSMSPSLWLTASWIFSNLQNSTSSVTVSFWYGFSFQTSLLDNQRCSNWGHMNDEGLWGWVLQLYDPIGITWKILCMGIHAFSGSRDFHQFLKTQAITFQMSPASSLPSPKTCSVGHCWYSATNPIYSHTKAWQPWCLDSLRKDRIFSETLVEGMFSFCFFPKKLSQRQVWYSLHKPVLVPRAAASPTPPLR